MALSDILSPAEVSALRAAAVPAPDPLADIRRNERVERAPYATLIWGAWG